MSAPTDTENLALTAPVIKVAGSPLDVAVQNDLVALRVNKGLSMMARFEAARGDMAEPRSVFVYFVYFVV